MMHADGVNVTPGECSIQPSEAGYESKSATVPQRLSLTTPARADRSAPHRRSISP